MHIVGFGARASPSLPTTPTDFGSSVERKCMANQTIPTEKVECTYHDNDEKQQNYFHVKSLAAPRWLFVLLWNTGHIHTQNGKIFANVLLQKVNGCFKDKFLMYEISWICCGYGIMALWFNNHCTQRAHINTAVTYTTCYVLYRHFTQRT